VLDNIYAAEWEILSSSHSYKKTDYNTIRFLVKVPNDDKVAVKYKVRKSWKVNQ